MSNPYTFHIGNLSVVVYASTKDEATKIFSESIEKHDNQIRKSAIHMFADRLFEYDRPITKDDILDELMFFKEYDDEVK